MLFCTDACCERFPQTRYMGSKRKLLGFLSEIFSSLEFDSALDPFCGTGSVAYLLKCMKKKITASDALQFNAVAARALIENSEVRLKDTLNSIIDDLPQIGVELGIVERLFDELFFEREENRFIDQAITRINSLDGYKRDLALYSLFQACLAKRPYNLFHRANLYMRRKDVSRSFGNKATWDRPFDVHMKHFAAEADKAVFDSGRPCKVLCQKIEDVNPDGVDLVYLDPPYISGSGTGVDYLDFYHFLEGLCEPDKWEQNILHRYKHKPLVGKGDSPWADAARIDAVFEETIKKFADSTLVISYRSEGFPSIDDITGYMKKAGKKVSIVDAGKYTYALSRNKKSREIVLVGR